MEIKAKRKRKERLILIDFNCINREDLIKTIAEIRIELKKIFREHIGKENYITPYELFYLVYKINPQFLDIYKRTYWYNILKKILNEMRKNNELFVINNGYALYVLKTEEELISSKNRVNKHIVYLETIKNNADEWVRERKWE